jgi:hypothetical protein
VRLFISRSLLRSASFLVQNCAILRNALQNGFVRLSDEKHAAQSRENVRKNSGLNYKSAPLPSELCRQKNAHINFTCAPESGFCP